MKYSTIQQFTLLGLLLGTSITFLWMLGHYLYPVFWAIVIAIIFYPVYRYFSDRFHGRSAIASLTTIGSIILLVVIPLSIVVTMIIQESITLYETVTTTESSIGIGLFDQALTSVALLEPIGISADDVTNRLRSWFSSGLETVSGSIISATQSTFSFIISLAIMLYLLFFMFKDGSRLEQLLYRHIPLDTIHTTRLFGHFTATTRAVAKGTIAIAILQGILGGIAFWIAGVSAPTLWGAAMGVLAIIPAIGPALIWLPAGVILLITGSVWQGVFILIVGALLVSVIDEFLRPILIGRGTKMPDAVVLLATLGGLATFGISGFIVGPIVAAFFISFWVIFAEQYRDKQITQ